MKIALSLMLALTLVAIMNGEEIDKRELKPNEVLGENLKAFLTAYDEFKSRHDYPPGKQKLENYTVTFVEKQSSDTLEITFITKRLKSEAYAYGGEFTLGRDIQYLVDRKTNSILKISFFR